MLDNTQYNLVLELLSLCKARSVLENAFDNTVDEEFIFNLELAIELLDDESRRVWGELNA